MLGDAPNWLMNMPPATGPSVNAQSLGLNTLQQQHLDMLRLLMSSTPRFQHVGMQPGMQPGMIPGAPGVPGQQPVMGSQQQMLNYLQVLRLMQSRNPLMASGEQAGSPLTMMMMGQGMGPPEPAP